MNDSTTLILNCVSSIYWWENVWSKHIQIWQKIIHSTQLKCWIFFYIFVRILEFTKLKTLLILVSRWLIFDTRFTVQFWTFYIDNLLTFLNRGILFLKILLIWGSWINRGKWMVIFSLSLQVFKSLSSFRILICNELNIISALLKF